MSVSLTAGSALPCPEQKAALQHSLEDKQQLYRNGNANQNHRLPSRSTATSHKTQNLHSVTRYVHQVALYVTVKHHVVTPFSCTAVYTAIVQSQHRSVLLLLSTQTLYNLSTAQYCSCYLHSHCTISTPLSNATAVYTATVQSQHCSVLHMPR